MKYTLLWKLQILVLKYHKVPPIQILKCASEHGTLDYFDLRAQYL